jgi:hypothetical protein
MTVPYPALQFGLTVIGDYSWLIAAWCGAALLIFKATYRCWWFSIPRWNLIAALWLILLWGAHICIVAAVEGWPNLWLRDLIGIAGLYMIAHVSGAKRPTDKKPGLLNVIIIRLKRVVVMPGVRDALVLNEHHVGKRSGFSVDLTLSPVTRDIIGAIDGPGVSSHEVVRVVGPDAVHAVALEDGAFNYHAPSAGTYCFEIRVPDGVLSTSITV